jgi:hypothetical protein
MHCCDQASCLSVAQQLRQRGNRIEVDVLGCELDALVEQARQRGISRVLTCHDGVWHLLEAEEERILSQEALLTDSERWRKPAEGGW